MSTFRRYPDSFQVTLAGDREIRIERTFGAPPALVFDAFTRPELVRRWLLGPEGWTMPVCEIDLRAGGRYRYVWRKETAGTGAIEMGMGGEFREVSAPRRLVATERFDEAWYPGEALNTTGFAQVEAGTAVTIAVQYESAAAREIAARSGMETGMAAGFARLEELLGEATSAQ